LIHAILHSNSLEHLFTRAHENKL